MPVYLWGLGTVQAYNSVTVRAQIDGQLTRVVFTEGQMVHEGDLLAQIDSRSYQALLDQAVAKKAEDESQLDDARRNLTRYTVLAAKNYEPKQQLDATTDQVAQYQAAVQGDQAAIDYARVNLGYTSITSPIDGRAGIRQIDAGNIVHANDAAGLVVISQIHPVSVLFTLAEDALPQILKAQGSLPVAVFSRDGSEKFDSGTLALLDNAVDTSTGTLRLKATLPNAAGLLWPGEFVKVRLQVETARNAVTIPLTAVQDGPDGSFAFVVGGDGRVATRNVTLGPEVDGTIVAESGIAAGDVMVTSGQYLLQPGTRVKVEHRP